MHVITFSPEIQHQQETNCDKSSQNNSISPPLRPYPTYKAVDTRYLCCRRGDPPIDVSKSFSLQSKIFVDRVGLIDNSIDYIVTSIQPCPLLQHVVGFGFGRVVRAIRVDIRSNIGEEMLSVS